MNIEGLELLSLIDNLNIENKIDYGDYLELHDNVSLFIKQQQETIESLRCCGNCKHCLTMSQVPNKLHHATYCRPCINNSNWQPIK